MTDFFSGRYQYGFDASSGFTESPDGTVGFVRAGGRRFYPQQIQRVKPENTFRVITVGDSIARGASLEEAYPALLAERLAARGYRVESINLAVAGFGARRQQLVLERALSYQPDLLILHFGMSNEFEDERDWLRARQSGHSHPREWPTHSYLIGRLHEFKVDQVMPKLLPERVRMMMATSDADDEARANRDPARVAAWQSSFSAVFDRSLDMVRKADVPTLLIPRVVLQRVSAETSLDDSGLGELLRGRLSARMHWIDLAAVFGAHPDAGLFTGDRIHWHPPAHRLLANSLAEIILTRSAGLAPELAAKLDRAHKP